MNIQDCYTLLRVTESSSDREIVKSYKTLALQFHPDRNRDNAAWANQEMTRLNIAYSAIMGHRFKKTPRPEDIVEEEAETMAETAEEVYSKEIDPDVLINRFRAVRQRCSDAIYRYFQYNLYNFHIREKVSHQGIFNEMAAILKKAYHAVKSLKDYTSDEELHEHFELYADMIFKFYRSSECLNIIDSYSDLYEVEAYRMYKRGDEALHVSQKEIFYDRHNRGSFKRDIAFSYCNDAIDILSNTLKVFGKSSWAVETEIKCDFAITLRKYLALFFT